MEFFRSLDPQKQKLLKITGFLFLGVVALAIISNVFSPFAYTRSFNSFGKGGGIGMPAYDMAVSEYSVQAGAPSFEMGKVASLSTRNVMPIVPGYGGTTGNDAEAFEITDYNATIETTTLEETCEAITSLKAKTYVIFERSNSYDRGCSHTFKVEHTRVPEILAVIKDLDPRELSENTQTIKQQINDFTSQEEILAKKLVAIDETLKTALAAYDEITVIATRSQDAGSLAKIIDSKVGIIERLTQERININQQLDYVARAKGDQLDRLDYTYFNVYVYENKYIDGKNIADSWKQALRNFVSNTNFTIQQITIGLIGFVLIAFQYILYALILLVIVKYGWRFVKGFWNK